MSRPPLEVADVIRSAGQPLLDRRHGWITGQHLKVLHAIVRCHTAALGGHRDQCSSCRYSAISYNSCRNRHCPKCQGNARHRWLEARRQELLPTCYVHVGLHPATGAGAAGPAKQEGRLRLAVPNQR